MAHPSRPTRMIVVGKGGRSENANRYGPTRIKVVGKGPHVSPGTTGKFGKCPYPFCSTMHKPGSKIGRRHRELAATAGRF